VVLANRLLDHGSLDELRKTAYEIVKKPGATGHTFGSPGGAS
jgi:hypothetical protein